MPFEYNFINNIFITKRFSMGLVSSIINMMEQFTNVTPSVHQATAEAASSNSAGSNAATEDQSINIAAKRNWSGFLSLPPEIRLMIYRELFHHPITFSLESPEFVNIPALLATCKLINKEAFEVIWGENTYYWSTYTPPLLPSILHRIEDTIQRLHVSVRLSCYSTFSDEIFYLIDRFGKPAKIRGLLVMTCFLDNDEFVEGRTRKLFISALGRFTNFRSVQIVLVQKYQKVHISDYFYRWIAKIMQPRLGPSKPHADEVAIVFQPNDYLYAQQQQETVDWMDLLDGIRLDWNGDGTSANRNADQNVDSVVDASEGAAPNWNFGV